MGRLARILIALATTTLLCAGVAMALWVAGGWSWEAVERAGWLAAIVTTLLPIAGVWGWALRSDPRHAAPPSERPPVNIVRGGHLWHGCAGPYDRLDHLFFSYQPNR